MRSTTSRLNQTSGHVSISRTLYLKIFHLKHVHFKLNKNSTYQLFPVSRRFFSLSCFFLSSFCLVRLNLLIDVSPYELVRYLNINECVTVYSECADCERTSSNCTPLSRVIYEGAWGLVTGWHAKQVKQRPKNRVDITFDVLRMRITYRPPSLDIFANINPSDFLGKRATWFVDCSDYDAAVVDSFRWGH